MDESQFRKFLTSSVRLYISVDQWLEEMSKFDLSIGLRLHGNMVPFQSGCPAIWITHDSRTSELVETMALPNLSLEKFLELKSLEDMKECCNFNFNDYYLKRKALSIQYKSVLDYYDIKNDIN